MADSLLDLAPIIEPPSVAPSGLLDGGNFPWADFALIVAICLLAGFLLSRLRRRLIPLRTLRQLARINDPGQVRSSADALARLLQRHSVVLDQTLQADLERLRFGPPFASAPELLAHLCREAETALGACRT